MERRKISEKIYSDLISMQDIKYKEFNAKLIPNIEASSMIGVRTPELRKYAKRFSKMPESKEFMNMLPHTYYEENNIHGFLIEELKEYNQIIEALSRFLPYVDNWATCDLISLKIFRRYPDEVYEKVKQWIASEHTYTVRFGIGILLSFFLEEHFSEESMNLAVSIRSEEYYINMMIAWYIATALAKQYKAAIRIIEEKKLDIWVHNKAIQKAVESRRISDDKKLYLKSFKRI